MLLGTSEIGKWDRHVIFINYLSNKALKYKGP